MWAAIRYGQFVSDAKAILHQLLEISDQISTETDPH
jgi:hypothetical protein